MAIQFIHVLLIRKTIGSCVILVIKRGRGGTRGRHKIWGLPVGDWPKVAV